MLLRVAIVLMFRRIFSSSPATLVGGLEHFLFLHILGNFIIPTDELHHFSEG